MVADPIQQVLGAIEVREALGQVDGSVFANTSRDITVKMVVQ
ncbi:MAG: hypothetical protein R3E89_18660 [Thiolinea sp.]